jgi:hypothetical protein
MILKKSPKIFWTNHAEQKLRFYRLSASRVLQVLRHPERKEEGVAPNTVAVMQPAGSKKHPYEIWLMYQTIKSKIPACADLPAGKAGASAGRQNPKSKTVSKIKIISCWRYPGASPLRQPPIQEDDLKFWQ